MAEFFVSVGLPAEWFVYALGESVKPINYRGDRHDNTGDGFWCELQHRDGGRLTLGKGATPHAAVCDAIVRVEARNG